MAANGTFNGHEVASPKIVLYTNHNCPYAHRAHITLTALKLPVEEVIIDLETPRPQWYLDINPRGLVPSIKYTVPGIYNDTILTESAIVSEFLCNSFPSHLLPATRQDPTAPLRRARIRFFTDTWDTKVASLLYGAMLAGAEEKEAKVEAWVAAVQKELEPLLADASPFFGGSEELTFAEVHTGPFLLRWYALAEHGELLPKSLAERFDALPNFGKWAKAVRESETVKAGIWDADGFVKSARKRVEKLKAEKK